MALKGDREIVSITIFQFVHTVGKLAPNGKSWQYSYATVVDGRPRWGSAGEGHGVAGAACGRSIGSSFISLVRFAPNVSLFGHLLAALRQLCLTRGG